MSLLGAHRITKERSYSVHRNSGVYTILGTFVFAMSILFTEGAIIATPAWQPFLDWTDGWIIVGGTLLISPILGFIGLAADDDDLHLWPRVLSLLSSVVGMAWFVIASISFLAMWYNGWLNAGPLLAFPGFILHANRFWLLSDWPARAKA